MGFFDKPAKIKDAQYYTGVVFMIYGKYLVENWPNNPMQERLGTYFKSIVDYYDNKFNGTYFSNLYSLGCLGKNFNSEWSIKGVETVLNNNESNLTSIKLATESFILRNGPDTDIAKALLKCGEDNAKIKSDKESDIESWLVQCVYSTVLDRARLKRARDERNDSLPEAVVSGLIGGLMLCCHKELIK
jgi:hypothetical protein